MCECVQVSAIAHIQTTFMSHVCSSDQLRLSGLAVRTFTCQAILPAPKECHFLQWCSH